MGNGYDRVSSFYDRLSRLVFGNKLEAAHLFLLKFISPAANVLIVGGGSGWILEAIAAMHPSGLIITFIDASPKMEAMAEKRGCAGNTVSFIAQKVQSIGLVKEYDVVITPFFFDNFGQVEAANIFGHLAGAVKDNGLWLDTDFQNTSRLSHKALLKCMYLFFSIFCGIQTLRLPGTSALFKRSGFSCVDQQIFMDGFVLSTVYTRINSTE